MRTATSRRTTMLIAAAAMGVYVLVMAGATTAIAEATAACSTWPTCDGRWLVPLDEPALLIAWGHRVLAVVVGLLLVAAVIVGWRDSARSRVRAALGIALLLYPVQVALGAAIAVEVAAVSGLHLAAGMSLFVSLLLALAWTLDSTAPDSGSASWSPAAPPSNEETGSTASVRASASPWGTALALLRLTKPRLMWLLCLVAAAGMALAAGPALTIRTAVATLAGGVLAIGASGTFNHVLERDVDRRMQRTADRPLPTEQVGVPTALAFGGVLTVAAVVVFLSINLLAAALGLAAIAYYSVVYTLVLKPNTVQNTVIGGLAGSFPAVIGAAAATNTVGPAALLLAGVIFLWTPAHFYNLALAYREDYARGDLPMLPVVKGEATTRTHILLYLGATLLAAMLLTAIGGLGPLYAVTAVGFGAIFLWTVVRLHLEPGRRAAMRSFHASNAFLGALLLAVVLDTLAL